MQRHVPNGAIALLLQIDAKEFTWVGPNFIADRAKIAHAAGRQLRAGQLRAEQVLESTTVNLGCALRGAYVVARRKTNHHGRVSQMSACL